MSTMSPMHMYDIIGIRTMRYPESINYEDSSCPGEPHPRKIRIGSGRTPESPDSYSLNWAYRRRYPGPPSPLRAPASRPPFWEFPLLIAEPRWLRSLLAAAKKRSSHASLRPANPAGLTRCSENLLSSVSSSLNVRHRYDYC